MDWRKGAGLGLTLQFLGAAETVTGSKYLLAEGSLKILVDCGLFQGLKNLRLQNWEKSPFDPRTLSAVVLTHAHVDHSGFVPRLVKEGFFALQPRRTCSRCCGPTPAICLKKRLST